MLQNNSLLIFIQNILDPFMNNTKLIWRGVQKNPQNYRIHPQYFASSKDFDMFVSCL